MTSVLAEVAFIIANERQLTGEIKLYFPRKIINKNGGFHTRDRRIDEIVTFYF